MSKPTARDMELLSMPTIASQMPVTFANGAQWDVLECQCRGCGETLPSEQVRGAVVRQTPHMASVEACGVCHPCLLVTRYVYRLYDDTRITGPRGGGWHTWRAQAPSFFQRIKRTLGF